MKKLVALLLLCSSMQVFGQLTFVTEKESQGFKSFFLSDGSYKLYSTNYDNSSLQSKIQSINIFNNDLTLSKTINISQTFPYDTLGHFEKYISYKSIKDFWSASHYFTDKLFNLDDKLELMISYSSKKITNGVTKYFSVTVIINEDGKEIQKFSNLDSDSEGIKINLYNKLFVEINNKAKIYSVPGNLPCPSSCSQKSAAIAPISPANEFKEIQVNGFPNPSSDKVTLAYALPEGVSFGTLRLYTQTGELVKEFKVSSQVDHLELPVSDYTPGTYYYELQAGGNTSGGKKMVVIH